MASIGMGRWDWRTGTHQTTNIEAYHVALGGGRWVATSNQSHEVILYDMKAGAVTLTLPPEESEIWCLAWSPDATRLAVSLTDGGIAIWDLEQVRQRLAEFGITIPSTASPVRP
jgi:WD40 repeat protein